MKTAAIVGWTGNGEVEDLRRSVAAKLATPAIRVRAASGSILVEGGDPVVVSRRLGQLPGVAWVAAGFQFKGDAEFLSRLEHLAGRYLRPGAGFSLRVRVVESEREEGDLLLEGIGAILKLVKGSRVSEKGPDVVFRAAMVGDGGAVGVELREGPGGVATSRSARVSCLVSGGYHSSATAWMAALSGYTLTLVHARDDDESLRQVARLYAEISHRVDASGLALEVLTGDGTAGERLAGWLGRQGGEVVAGIHPECRGLSLRSKFRRFPSVATPLLLLGEEQVRAKVDELGLKRKAGDSGPTLVLGRNGERGGYRIKRYGGKESDVSGVLDSLMG